MSSKLIELTHGVLDTAGILVWVFVAILVILGISGVIYTIHSRKEKRLRETKYEADSKYSKRHTEIMEMTDLEFSQKQAEREKAREERDKVYKDVDDKIRVLDKRYKAVDDFFSAIRNGLLIVACFLGMCILIVSTSLGGSISDVREVKDTQNQNVVVNAYYRVDYERVEQHTLTVFVKNNSDKTLDKALISEKVTGSSAYVYTIEPGQEKIVSIVVYPNDTDKYEFEINNVEFKQ